MCCFRSQGWTAGRRSRAARVGQMTFIQTLTYVSIYISLGKEPDLDNAFDKLLATFESDYQISLHFGAQRRMLVTVKEASLEQVQEAVHPAAR